MNTSPPTPLEAAAGAVRSAEAHLQVAIGPNDYWPVEERTLSALLAIAELLKAQTILTIEASTPLVMVEGRWVDGVFRTGPAQ